MIGGSIRSSKFHLSKSYMSITTMDDSIDGSTGNKMREGNGKC